MPTTAMNALCRDIDGASAARTRYIYTLEIEQTTSGTNQYSTCTVDRDS